MSVVVRIQNLADSLTPAERRLVQAVVTNPREAALGTVSALARGAGVHEATASRLVRKLGFGSYAKFRQALQTEFLPSQEPATRLQRTIDDAAAGNALQLLAQREAEALTRIADHVGASQIEDAAALLMGAERIFLFGRGNAEMLSLMMLKRFRRFGCAVSQLSGDPRELAEQVLDLRPDDIVLSFIFRRAPRGYQPLMESARDAGATTMVIAGSIGPTLSPAPDHLLTAPRSGDPESFQTLTVPMTVCNAIVIAAASLDKDRSLRKLERLGELIKRFE